MKRQFFLTVLIITLLAVHSSGFAKIIHEWEVYTITFKSKKSYENPYRDIPADDRSDLLKVTFTGVEGEAKGTEITMVGFWNGDQEWAVNFAPPLSGKWKYKSKSIDRGLNGKSGSFEVVRWDKVDKDNNPTRHGFVKVRNSGEQAGHYFEYSDRQPFLWIADTWWNWTKRSIQFETFKELVDDRSEKGFTIGQLFVPGNGWGRESNILDSSYTILDPDHMKHVEEMIKYANTKGITVWVHAWWSRPNLDQKIGEEKMRRWWRYLIHRLSAYNVIWVLAGEYNMHNNGGFDIDFWKDLGRMVDEEDPYERIISLHNTPPFWSGGAEAPQWSTGSVLHEESWLDYNQSQVGHGKYANEMIPKVIAEEYMRKPSKPIVVTEPWYEFIEGNPTGMDVRFAAWSGILSGAAGHTYGGGHVWLAHVPESAAGGGSWPLEKEFDRTTYNYEGAVSMNHLADFFKNVTWWNMAPHPELVLEYPQPFCLADPGNEYVIYLRYGGGIKLKMSPSGSNVDYSYYWYNPATGQKYDKKEVEGDEVLEFRCPESYPGVTDYKDWVLHIKRK